MQALLFSTQPLLFSNFNNIIHSKHVHVYYKNVVINCIQHVLETNKHISG